MKNYSLIILMLSLFVNRMMAQSDPTQPPTIIPPSPVAQSFMRYGEIPVDYSTGVPNIEIPIYTLEGRKLKLPISISYHASGIKVNDVASEVGLGWVLNCGGIVARTILGTADETRTTSRKYNYAQELIDDVRTKAPIYDVSCECYLEIENFETYFNWQIVDPMTDRFFYKLPTGVSGVFINNYLNNNDIITLPYRPLKIEKTLKVTNPGNYRTIESIKITDENGTVYLFESFLTASTRNFSEWYLRKIISEDGLDIIEFNYTQQGPNQATPAISFALTVHTPDLGETCFPSGVSSSSISQSSSPSTLFNTPILTSVVSSKAKVTFIYDTQARSDFNQLKRLSEITISPISSPSTIIKRVQFTPKYFGSKSSDYRLGLDKVTISAPGDLQPQKYEFKYETQVLPPYPYKMSGTVTYSEDFWGYYNGKNNPTQIPLEFIENENDKSAFGADRNSDLNSSRACMIKEIIYPTGGKTVFQFERNFTEGIYPYKSNSGGYAGGFRISTITNYDERGEVVDVKTYEYSGGQARQITRELFSYVQQACIPNEYVDPNEGWKNYCWIRSINEIVLSDPLLPLEVGAGLPIMYGGVVEYKGTRTNNTGKTVYIYNSPHSPSDYGSSPEHPVDEPRCYHSYYYDKGNNIPELKSKTEYAFDGASYHLVTRVVNNYTKLYTREFQTGIKLTRTQSFPEIVGDGYGPSFVGDYIQSIVALDTKAYQEASLITSTDHYTFDPVDSTKYILIHTENTYNENNLGIKETSILSSNNDVLKTSYKYPNDFISEPGTPYSTMVNDKHILSPVIEQSESNGTTHLNSTKTNYYDWGNNVIAPQTVETKKGINDYETRVSYTYDNTTGNIVTASKTNGTPESYIWGYNQTLPVVKIVGKAYSDIPQSVKDAITNHTFSGSTAYSSIAADMAYIKTQLATLLSDATCMVTFYTYAPLIGMTSQTDPNGVTTYFEYDTFGRLKCTRNDDGDILKSYEYHYKQ